MNASTAYDLHWNCIPMGAIRGYENWYYPYLGSGIYMLVLATQNNMDHPYVGFYVGQSKDIGCRWLYHVCHWFGDPDEGFSIPNDADAFLADPVGVINNEAFSKGLPNRQEIVAQIVSEVWFCFAEVRDLQPGHSLENVENVIQQGLMQHANIQQPGWIGDTGRGRPTTELLIRNHFGRPFLRPILPCEICFEPARGIR